MCTGYGRLAEEELPSLREKLSSMLGKASYWCYRFGVTPSPGTNPLPMLLSRPNKLVGLPRWTLGELYFGLLLVLSMGKVDACSHFLRKK